MTEIVTDTTLQEYEDFIASHPNGHFMQSSLWAKQKPEWEWVAIVRRDNNSKIIGSLSMLIRKLPGIPSTLMYCCRGPVCDLNDYDTILDLLEGAKRIAESFRSYCIKLDPDIHSNRTDIRDLLISAGFKLLDNGKDFEGIQRATCSVRTSKEDRGRAAWPPLTQRRGTISVLRRGEESLSGRLMPKVSMTFPN